MDVKEAVKVAKVYVADLFADEGAANLGLEEVEFEPHDELWRVTVGFNRNLSGTVANALAIALGETSKRHYKVVTISDRDRKILSMRQREGMD